MNDTAIDIPGISNTNRASKLMDEMGLGPDEIGYNAAISACSKGRKWMEACALLSQMEARGLRDKILLVCCGEMGRNPRINKKAGRDHWPGCFSIQLAGAGIHGGPLYGASDSTAAWPARECGRLRAYDAREAQTRTAKAAHRSTASAPTA